MQVDQNTTNNTLQDKSPTEFDGTWEKKGRSPNSAAAIGLLVIGVLYVYAQTILFMIGYFFSKVLNQTPEVSVTFVERMSAAAKEFTPSMRISLLISQYCFMLLPTWWLIRKWHTHHVREYLRLKYCDIKEIILAILATLAIIPTGAYIGNELMRWFKFPDIFYIFYQEVFSAHSLFEFLWLVFLVAITPAICEEIFFRGYVQRTFERTISFKSVLLVGVIFGFYHMQPLSLITLSILGIIFGFFYYRSKSLLPSMAGHFTNNLLATFLFYKEIKINGINLSTAEQIPILWVVVTLPIGILILWFYYRLTKKRRA
jgi:membrane protease YdiL (CAAX protease family)